jgi:hypothetical protein
MKLLIPSTLQKHKGYTLGYFITGRTIFLNARCELTNQLFNLNTSIFKAKQYISTHHKTLNVSTDSSEWQHCMRRLQMGFMGVKILEKSQKHRCQKAYIRGVPFPGSTKYRHRL